MNPQESGSPSPELLRERYGTKARTEYVTELLEKYRCAPGTLARIRPSDRRLAIALYERAVPLETVEAAFLLAAVRRGFADPANGPVSMIRSLHYYLPLIDDLLEKPLEPTYLAYLTAKLKELRSIKDPGNDSPADSGAQEKTR